MTIELPTLDAIRREIREALQTAGHWRLGWHKQKTMNKQTQTKLVLDHLKGVGPITPLDAMRKYGIMRLGARVWDLRKEGVPIKTDIITVKTRSGEARVARYSL